MDVENHHGGIEMKDRILHLLVRFHEKFRSPVYPVVFGVMALFLVMGALLVFPSLADETGDEPLAETVSEEEIEPTMTPDVTVRPLVTEAPEEPEDTAVPDADEEDGAEEDEETVGETEEPSQTPAATQEAAAGLEEDSPEPEPENTEKEEEIKTVSPQRRAAAVAAAAEPVQLQKPECKVIEEPVGPYTYPLNDTTIQVKVQVTPPAGAGYKCQWHVSRSAGGAGEELTGHGAQTTTYTLPADTGAGTYYYYCVVKSVDNDGHDKDSEAVRSRDIVVSIAKGEPMLEHFDLSAVKSEYYYTGEVIDPSVVSRREGMGSAYIVVKDGAGVENRPMAETENDPIYLHVSEGDNYIKKTIDLNKTITIRRLPAPASPYNVTGTKGKLVDDRQWYTSDVKIVPKSGFLISSTGYDFTAELVYSDNGTNQGPVKNDIYLQNKSNKAITDAITVTQKRDGQINIDKEKPSAAISYNSATYDSVDHDYNGSYDNQEIVFNLTANDDVSGVANRFYYWSKDVLAERQLTGVAWKSWAEGDPLPLEAEGTTILYAKVEDKAGNAGYASSDRITIDKTAPEIVCGKKSLGDEKSYFADRKKLTVNDTHLRYVTVRRGDTVVLTRSGDDIVKGSTSFSLDRPVGETADVTFEITAEDAAGNEKITRLTLKDPTLDVEVEDIDFGSGSSALTYGYEAVSAKSVSMRNKADGKPVVADSIELELAEGAESSFELVDDKTKVRPKQGLHVGTYTEAVRIYYNGEAESTTVCRCTLTVEKANMFVSYTGQSDVGYHTLPDLKGTIEYAAADFKNGDTKKVFETDPNFVEPKLYYGADQEYTSDKRAMETMRLIPGGGSSSDYEFLYKDGELEVRQHVLRSGYVIEGEKVDGYNWYVSANVAIRPADGYRMSDSQEPDSFATASQLISVAGPTNGVEESFYVMNNTTGEISACMKETIKIDNTAPYFRTGEGITVSSDLWSEFCNSISFGIFFNNTKAVTIRATDEESGLDSIQYCVSPAVVAGNKEELESNLTWQEYEDGFSITPEEYERAVIYAKITNHAGLVTYVSSNGLVFDNKQPDINKVEGDREQGIIDEKEYITEELLLRVSDHNLEEVTLYEGTSVTATGSALTITEDADTRYAEKRIPCPTKGSKTYTVLARDRADNNAEREFTITKPIYDIVADTLKIEEADYGYGFVPQTAVTWKNTEQANADATVSRIELGNEEAFEVRQSGNDFWIAAKKGLTHGTYTTDVTLVYNGGKRAGTTCSFRVDKAVLTATYAGGDLYYHEKAGGQSAVKVTGFVKQNGVAETPQTAAGYRAPTVEFDGVARETREIIPAGGKADNYTFKYQSGLLLVDRRYAKAGKDGQYTVEGQISDTGWYTSDITLRPKEGFVFLRTEEDEEPLGSIVLTEDAQQGEESFYVMNEASGEIYHKSVFNYKRDTLRPGIYGITPDGTYETNSCEVVVEDENLFSVTVNGKSQTVEGGRARFNLTADQETIVYVVVATDLAGNMNDMTVVLNQPASLPASATGEDALTQTQDPAATLKPGATGTSGGVQKQSRSNSLKKGVKVVEGAPDTSLTTSTAELKTSVLTSGEQRAVDNGSNAKIELHIKGIDSQVPQADKELVIANLGDYTVGRYFDITLWKKVGNSSEKKVTNTKNAIAITLSIPEELRSASREFALLRVHGGSVSVLRDQDSALNTITVETDRFSTYALAYKKKAAAGTQSGGASGAGGTEYAAGVEGSPETGDEASPVLVSILFVVALAGIILTMTVRRIYWK